MPASSDYPAADDQQDSGNNSPAYREEQKKSKHAREGRRQAKKKDEQGRADTNKERASWIPPEELYAYPYHLQYPMQPSLC